MMQHRRLPVRLEKPEALQNVQPDPMMRRQQQVVRVEPRRVFVEVPRP